AFTVPEPRAVLAARVAFGRAALDEVAGIDSFEQQTVDARELHKAHARLRFRCRRLRDVIFLRTWSVTGTVVVSNDQVLGGSVPVIWRNRCQARPPCLSGLLWART